MAGDAVWIAEALEGFPEKWKPVFRQKPRQNKNLDRCSGSVKPEHHLAEGAHLVGHSFGGAAALLAAERRPGAVRSLTLIEPALIPIIIGTSALKKDSAAREDFLAMLRSWVDARTPAAYARTMLRGLGVATPGQNATTTPDEISEAQATVLGAAFLRARLASPAAMRRAARAVARAGIPVLVVTGGWSPTFEVVGRVTAELTGGRHITLPSPDHFVQLSAAEAFNAALTAFMEAAQDARTG